MNKLFPLLLLTLLQPSGWIPSWVAHADYPDSVVVFNEIQYNPGNSDLGEWVELHNQMGIRTDISGWSIRGVGYTFPKGTFIASGAYLVVYKNPPAGQLGPFSGSLDNGGESLELVTHTGRLMDRLNFGDSGKWPVEADGSGATLAKLNPNTASQPAENWTHSKIFGGTPGAVNFQGVSNAPEIVFNEIPALTEENFWLEVSNIGSDALDIGDFTISVNGDPAKEYKLPNQSIARGGLFLINMDSSEIRPSKGEKLFLYDASKEYVLDGQIQKERLIGRSLEHDNQWLYPSSATPGTHNTFQLREEVVISEISYNPAPQDSSKTNLNQWIEVANRTNKTVDLSGWTLSDGIRFTFPTGTSLAAGEHACVAHDADLFFTYHPTARLLGVYSGRLSRSGERLVLSDPNGNTADELRYYEGGRWPDAADAGGATLELRDLDADNNAGESWAASDESNNSSWKTYTYEGVAAASAVGPDNQWRDFIIGLNSAGEVWIDDIQVNEVSGGSKVQILENSNFEDGQNAWRFRGNHRHSRVAKDPDNPSNHILKLVATGYTEHMHNNVETTLIDGRSVVNGRTYEISFKAKWVQGSNQLNTRLYFNRLPRTTLIERPISLGTPGATNSQASENIGPNYSGLIHNPPVPAAGSPTTISVKAHDPDGLESLTLFYSVESQPFAQISMTESSNGLYNGTIPGQSAGSVVQFYVSAKDKLGAESYFPAEGADSHALYEVQDGRASGTQLHNLRLIMTPADDQWMHTNINVMSNDRLGSTVIYNEREIYYNTGVRLKSSQRGRLNARRVGFNVRFNEDQLFRGIHSTVAIDRSQGQAPGQKEILFNIMMTSAGGLSSKYNDLIRIIAPRDAHTGTAELQMARYTGITLGSQIKDGDKGTVFEYELIYYPREADANGYKIPQPDGVVGTRIRSLGDDKENYRWNFLIKNRRTRDDYSALIDYCKHFNLTGDNFHNGIEKYVDVDNWLRSMAFAVLSGAGDNYGANSQHNAQFYARPDGRVTFLPHDMDFAFSTTRSITANSDLGKIVDDPPRMRQYLGHLHDIISTTYNNDYMSSWSAHFASLDPAQNWNGHLAHINSRSANVLSQVTNTIPKINFSITGNDTLTFNDSTATLAGYGWVDIRKIQIEGGGELDVSWTGRNTWEARLPIKPGSETFTIEALNFSGQRVGSKTITIRNTSSTVPAEKGNLVISKIHFQPAAPSSSETATGFSDASDFEYVVLKNTGTQEINLANARFTSGINHSLPGHTLAPEEQAILARNRSALLNRFPELGSKMLSGEYGIEDTNVFSDRGEKVTLSTLDGAVIHDFAYENPTNWSLELPWPGNKEGSGFNIISDDTDSSKNPRLRLDWESSSLRDKLRITEISYDPVDGSELEFIEFTNISEAAIELGGVRLLQGAPVEKLTFEDQSLGAGERILLVSNRTAFLNHYGQSLVNKIAGEWKSGKLSNQGEYITIADQDGNLVMHFRYDNGNDWPSRAAGKGSTLEVLNPTADLENPDNWKSSTEYGGSPGTESDQASARIVVNELLAHTDPPQLDTIELVNSSSQDVDISNWWITDSSDQWKKFKIPNGTTLAAGEYIQFTEKDFNPNGLWNTNAGPRGLKEFTLSSQGESVWVVEADTSGKILNFVDKASFGASLNGVSFGRHLNSLQETFYTAQETTTLGTANSVIQIGPVVISEIMYHPVIGEMEWIEIQNISDNAIELFSENHPTHTWRVSGIGYNFPPDTILEKRGMVILTSGDPNAFRLENEIDEEVLVLGPFSGALDNEGERITIEFPDAPEPGGTEPVYVEVDAVHYRTHAPWPVGTAGNGLTLIRKNVDRFGTDPVHWKSSDSIGGTPGESYLLPPEPVIKVIGGRNIEVPVGTVYKDMGATALDDIDGDVSAEITVNTLEVDTSSTGIFKVWYSVSDSSGNQSEKSRTVHVTPLVAQPSFITHRYSFEGQGTTTVPDLIGSADASLKGGTKLNGNGFVDLDGVNDYVELPAGIITALNNTTLEIWLAWRGPSASQWQRILEFGDANFNYLYLTPRSSSSSLPVRFAFSINGGEQRINVANNIATDGATLTHFAFTFDDTNDRANLYIDGNLVGGRSTNSSLSELKDTQNWLGRSQYPNVPFFNGKLHEFRVYNRALTAAQIQSSHTKGMDEAVGPEIHSFTSSTPKLNPGNSAILEWDVRNADNIELDNNLGQFSDRNTIAVTPEETTTFNLTATNSAGSVTIPFTVVVDSESNQDTDGDGWTDEHETFLGTDPNDPKDLFMVQVSSEDAFNPQQGKFTYHIKWSSLAGRVYTVQSSSNLSNWSNEAALEGNGGDLTYSVDSADAIGFFRLQIE